ncbi:hypothetical protein U3A58_07025 [Algoriphagus sp. C2-6-M1]|uniref:hypothetical protein n=1 Tax=Algoriphagus persicinus TaxID=3108754 RepID=UPI002B3FB7F0|nr:hypothetical protein [Algoriphagus sp. C2-6-M1]MEB2780140.1 hypothetical protein [Algoriphagus sp. C2-6-M1]
MELSLKEIFEAAKKQFAELINIQESDFRLEQIEFKKEEKAWDVVVSYLQENKNRGSSAVSVFSFLPYERIYKRLKIDENKEVVGIYMFSESK